MTSEALLKADSGRTEAEVRALRPHWQPFQYVRDGKVLAEILFDQENEDEDSFIARFFMNGGRYGEIFTSFSKAKHYLETQIRERGL